MPAPTDRSFQIADAVLRLVARDGIEAVSMRKVAAEAGHSLGAVQRTFADKDTLLRAALVRSIEQADERIAARLGDRDLQPAELLRAAALEVLPLEAEALAAERVWLAFFAHAAVTPDFSGPVAERYAQSRAAIAAVLPGAAGDAETTAAMFVGLVDGLAVQMLAGVIAPDAALGAVEAFIARLLP